MIISGISKSRRRRRLLRLIRRRQRRRQRRREQENTSQRTYSKARIPGTRKEGFPIPHSQVRGPTY